MKLRFVSVLPNRWDDEYADIRAIVLTLIFMGGVPLLGAYGLGEANAFLMSGLVAILVVYWTPPLRKETYLHWIATNCVILFGLYVSLFKLPLLVAGLVGYRAAQILCVTVYVITCWFLIRRKAKVLSEE
ncbi:MAG TPA: hypothetical protein VFT48_10540 [Pyrinomonadaceae bacterium]|nr:hypothetical protein [Pyrinomonadaceae bacterium]